MVRFVWAGMLMLLTGCFEAELAHHVNEDRSLTRRTALAIDSRFYDLVDWTGQAAALCPSDARVEENDRVICRTEAVLPLSALPSRPGLTDEGLAVSAREMAGGLVRISIPVGAIRARMAEQVEEQVSGAAPKGLTMALMQGSMADRTIQFTISGAKVQASTGTILPGAGVAEYHLPMAALFDPTVEVPETFSADVKPKVCANSFICD
ncbi:hypothetical protein [Oceanomicrobium pacificus]|uniref:Lipoprotein n=1 Tax=Oceanomicrobium pacificus TaxID=2692916 RepID=A0A6B0TSA9_9RHOB|nr:hypothetical protein [Oceanomicrobium pacificus]MXU65619.1 hypothetical protein [Oceanomicrobium pacificus]